MHTSTHPHAIVATFLASRDGMSREHVSRELAITRTPRSLYTLARILRAAQGMDEINAMPQEIARDFDGNNHAQLAERHHLTETEVYRSIKASGHAARLAKAA